MSIRYLVLLGVALAGVTGSAAHATEPPEPAPRPLGSDLPSFHAPEDPGAAPQMRLEETPGSLYL